MTIEELRTKSVAILGLGTNNWELSRFLLSQGVKLTIRESKPELKEKFEQSFPELVKNINWSIGPNILEGLTTFQIVFRSPSLPYLSPQFKKAIKKGVQVYSQTKLFFDLCPAEIIGVSGTKGKGTTSSLLYRLLTAGYKKGKVYLGGNIGVDPFSFYEKLTKDDLVILELSSFQLQDLGKSPHVAILLTVTKDHLDHHRSVKEYELAKSSLIAYQGEKDVAVINVHDASMQRYVGLATGKVYTYDRFQPKRQSVWAHRDGSNEAIFVQVGKGVDSLDSTTRKLLGDHNLDNILPAVLVAHLYGVPMRTMQVEIEAFPGLEHRLSHVGTFAGVDFYDDSIATTPESALVALEAFKGKRIHVVVGGNEKGGDYVHLAEVIMKHCISVSLLPGTGTKKLLPALRKQLHHSGCHIFDKAKDPLFPTILSGIHPHLEKGDVVLLAPAATSFASFKSASDRGDRFAQAVKERYGKLETGL